MLRERALMQQVESGAGLASSVWRRAKRARAQREPVPAVRQGGFFANFAAEQCGTGGGVDYLHMNYGTRRPV